jgi:pyruvate dehydrogenase E2 component (dihydrolipoamide acetyltransferase)
MPIEILMPALSPTMTEGNLTKWLKKEGDKIEPGEVIAEIETDKATMEVESIDEGIVAKILIAEGTEGVAVNQLIAVLKEDGEDDAVVEKFISNFSGNAANDSASTDTPKAESAPIASSAPATNSSGDRIKASPLARRIAEQDGVNLANLAGTGPHGRIIKADVLEAPKGGSTAIITPSFGRSAQEYTEIPNNNMRKVIARRLLESKQTIPHFYLNIDCNLDNLLTIRKQMNDAAPVVNEKPVYKISVNDLVIKAVALSLRDVPAANATWTDAAILQYNNVDVSIAVAIDGGLITPIVRNADQKSISQISNEMKDLAKRARENKLAPAEFQGGGFSISNLGMFGIKSFNAIVNPPQSAILAIGAGNKRPIIDAKGNVASATIMEANLSSDHRVIDGTVGAAFLAAFKKYIENPLAMFA